MKSKHIFEPNMNTMIVFDVPAIDGYVPLIGFALSNSYSSNLMPSVPCNHVTNNKLQLYYRNITSSTVITDIYVWANVLYRKEVISNE